MTGEEMTLQAHSAIMREEFSLLGIAPEKVTHEMRVFAAQVMYEMGVSLEVSCNSADDQGQSHQLSAAAKSITSKEMQMFIGGIWL